MRCAILPRPGRGTRIVLLVAWASVVLTLSVAVAGLTASSGPIDCALTAHSTGLTVCLERR